MSILALHHSHRHGHDIHLFRVPGDFKLTPDTVEKFCEDNGVDYEPDREEWLEWDNYCEEEIPIAKLPVPRGGRN